MTKSSWHKTTWAIISFHILAWLVWFSLPYFTQINNAQPPRPRLSPEVMQQIERLSGMPMPFFRKPPNEHHMFRLRFLENFYLMLVFYFNAYYLMPALLYQKKIWQYVASLVALLVLLLLGTNLYFHFILHDNNHRITLFGPRAFSSFFFLFITALSITYRTVSEKIKDDQLKQEKENANLKTELLFLRSQISPHFMFNVLNNMVALARKHSDQLEPSLIKLSGLMRYMLYEADADKVPVEKELEYLKGYVDLQQQRFAGSVEVNLNIENESLGANIEPMLLIPFVENAFKHGLGMVLDPRINISVKVKDGLLLMEVRNRFNKISGEIKDKTSGIGLSNVKRRLDLLYGTNHHLLVTSQDDWFNVLLQLKLT